MSFTDARNFCLKEGADLASIESPDESAFIKDFIGGSMAHIGLFYYQRERKWQWVDGSLATYRDWVQNNPALAQNDPEYTPYEK